MANESSKYTLDKVSSEVVKEINGELESGRNAAEEQIQSMLRDTKNEVAKVIDGSSRQAESLRRQIIGSAELEARNKLLRTLEDASIHVFDDALKKVSETSSAQYEKAVAGLIEEAVQLIGKGATVTCNAKDKKLVSSIINELNRKDRVDLKLDDKSIETVGGVVLSSKDRTVRFDNTFEARLERMKPQMRREVAKILGSTSQ